MKMFKYIIKDAKGIHARPAALLVKEAKNFNANITISLDDKTADLKRIFSVMSLGATVGKTVIITIEGVDEELGILALKKCLEDNL